MPRAEDREVEMECQVAAFVLLFFAGVLLFMIQL